MTPALIEPKRRAEETNRSGTTRGHDENGEATQNQAKPKRKRRSEAKRSKAKEAQQHHASPKRVRGQDLLRSALFLHGARPLDRHGVALSPPRGPCRKRAGEHERKRRQHARRTQAAGAKRWDIVMLTSISDDNPSTAQARKHQSPAHTARPPMNCALWRFHTLMSPGYNQHHNRDAALLLLNTEYPATQGGVEQPTEGVVGARGS